MTYAVVQDCKVTRHLMHRMALLFGKLSHSKLKGGACSAARFDPKTIYRDIWTFILNVNCGSVKALLVHISKNILRRVVVHLLMSSYQHLDDNDDDSCIDSSNG